MKIDLRRLEELVEQKFISKQQHPTADLLIWNYTQRCQFERFWTEETMMCRGLITDLEGNIVARPFKKFFNYEEHVGEDSKLPSLPLEDFEVTEKMDGSLGILYWIGDEPQIATRGSFVSDQAIKANEILKTKYKDVIFNPDYTYLFEIIFPDNRIVVNYGNMEDLVLLAVIETETGIELDPNPFNLHLSVVKRYDGLDDITKLKSLAEDNKEGFVIKFKSGVRTKLKFEEYVRLHRLVTGVNKKTIWEHLKTGTGVVEILDRVPDEFFKWVKQTVNELEFQFKNIEDHVRLLLPTVEVLPSRKEQALAIKDSPYKSVFFKMIDHQPYNELIWKMIRPVAERPYTKDIDA